MRLQPSDATKRRLQLQRVALEYLQQRVLLSVTVASLCARSPLPNQVQWLSKMQLLSLRRCVLIPNQIGGAGCKALLFKLLFVIQHNTRPVSPRQAHYGMFNSDSSRMSGGNQSDVMSLTSSEKRAFRLSTEEYGRRHAIEIFDV
jgi:hypothetical protein